MDNSAHADIRAIEALLETFQNAIATGDDGALPLLFCEEATAYFPAPVTWFAGARRL